MKLTPGQQILAVIAATFGALTLIIIFLVLVRLILWLMP